jgi:hypothetical protein
VSGAAQETFSSKFANAKMSNIVMRSVKKKIRDSILINVQLKLMESCKQILMTITLPIPKKDWLV